MSLAQYVLQQGGRIGEMTDAQKLAEAREAVADAEALVALRGQPGWKVLEREIREQAQRDKDALLARMQSKSLWKFLRDGDWKLAARAAGLERALETVENVIQKGVLAEQWLAQHRAL
jgi:hypothetical protein